MSRKGGLDLHKVRLSLNGTDLIPETSLAVGPGEVVTVMGPSGSGKSSLLAYICGVLSPAFEAAGRVWIDGDEVSRLPIERRRIGILFQDDLLYPHMTVGENLMFALPRAVKGRAARRQQVGQALSEADLAGYEDRDPETLSGGQRARVALMRTLLAKPRAVLLDEPFSKLDADTRGVIRRFVFEHITARGLPTLLVTHDARDAKAAGGPVLSLGNGEAVSDR
jgi:putative thiamine transport system ATP-binding protein